VAELDGKEGELGFSLSSFSWFFSVDFEGGSNGVA